MVCKLITKFHSGLFQSLAVRSGGFYLIAIPNLRIGLQVLYVIMMYISVYPVVITMRHSNVYEEMSLGIFSNNDGTQREPPKLGKLAGKLRHTITSSFSHPFPSTPGPQYDRGIDADFVRQQVRGQLAHDLWWLAVAVLLISCIEVGNFNRDPVTYSVFNIMFEVVSGYGCVGISTGLPNEAYSFSGGWSTTSKLILCAVMLRGRHRGLPVSLDMAVRLPGLVCPWNLLHLSSFKNRPGHLQNQYQFTQTCANISDIRISSQPMHQAMCGEEVCRWAGRHIASEQHLVRKSRAGET